MSKPLIPKYFKYDDVIWHEDDWLDYIAENNLDYKTEWKKIRLLTREEWQNFCYEQRAIEQVEEQERKRTGEP